MKIVLLGAGGKMGMRLGRNLSRTSHDVRYVETSDAGRQRLKKELDLSPTDEADALRGAEALILAVPDALIGKIATKIVPTLDPGTLVVILDPAAPYAGHLPARADIGYFVTHPCHPSIFSKVQDEVAGNDRFGGVTTPQPIVNALMSGEDALYARGEEIATIIWGPVLRSHRLTVEQLALLEPALSETLAASLLETMREGVEEVVKRGVPEIAARDFLLGHLNVLAAVTFEHIPGAFSDACKKAIENGKPRLMRDDWKDIFEPTELAESIRRIT